MVAIEIVTNKDTYICGAINKFGFAYIFFVI